MTALAWVLTALAVYRLTLLVVADKITEAARWWAIGLGHRLTLTRPSGAVEGTCSCGWSTRSIIVGGVGKGWPLATANVEDDHHAHVAAQVADGWRYLLTCPWCASVWLAGPAVASGLAWSTGWGWQLAAGALAVSGVTGFLARYAAPE